MRKMLSTRFHDTISDDIHRIHLVPLVTVAHVSIDIAAQVAAISTVRALESRLFPASVQQMPTQTALLLEDTIAIRARVLFLSGD